MKNRKQTEEPNRVYGLLAEMWEYQKALRENINAIQAATLAIVKACADSSPQWASLFEKKHAESLKQMSESVRVHEQLIDGFVAALREGKV